MYLEKTIFDITTQKPVAKKAEKSCETLNSEQRKGKAADKEKNRKMEEWKKRRRFEEKEEARYLGK
jgi:hypothetical protein